MIPKLLLAVVMAATSSAFFALPGTSAAALDHTPWTLPSAPSRCTTAQANSGDVAGCLLAFHGDPAESGWGAPPAPGVGSGWSWNGYTYNGSAALAGFEDNYIGANTTTVGGLSAGRLETHVAAQALFEGFLDEISTHGYRIHDASGYTFRCTSGSGGWSCPSGQPEDLSNHAWGLAIDMNAGTNPIRSYSSVGGQTACLTPIQTDLPRWVIETAEKWGLYWGGYGWNSGCPSTSTERTTVHRDPPHFEFRGTPDQAAAIAGFNLRNDPNAVCRPVVDERGRDTERCSRTTLPAAGTRLAVELDPPAGAIAAIINLTAVDAAGPGYLTLEDCGARSGERTTSALTFAGGEAVASMAIVPVDDGRFCVYRSTAVQSIVDVSGYLGPDGDPLWYEPTTPTRLTDTRQEGSCRPTLECVEGPVAGSSEHFVDAGAATRFANLTVVDGQQPGWLQAGECGDLGTGEVFSHLNYSDAAARANLAMVSAGDAGTCVYGLTRAHVIVDELGRLRPDAGFGWQLQAPERILDTRECTTWCDGRPGAGEAIELDLGSDAPGAAIAITVTDVQAPGYITIGACDDLESGNAPGTSNVNYAPGTTVTNLALVAVDGDETCVFTRAAAHVVVDVQARLVADRNIGVVPVDTTRYHDSREL